MNQPIEILLVDDDPTMRFYLFRLLTTICALEGKDVKINIAKNGEEAIQLIDTLRGELAFVLSDVSMPKVDGNGVAKHAILNCIPIILATATPALVDSAVAQQCHTVIEKPFTLTELKNVVLTLLLNIPRKAS
jgi:CheY-like chemotaxis protein